MIYYHSENQHNADSFSLEIGFKTVTCNVTSELPPYYPDVSWPEDVKVWKCDIMMKDVLLEIDTFLEYEKHEDSRREVTIPIYGKARSKLFNHYRDFLPVTAVALDSEDLPFSTGCNGRVLALNEEEYTTEKAISLVKWLVGTTSSLYLRALVIEEGVGRRWR